MYTENFSSLSARAASWLLSSSSLSSYLSQLFSSLNTLNVGFDRCLLRRGLLSPTGVVLVGVVVVALFSLSAVIGRC